MKKLEGYGRLSESNHYGIYDYKMGSLLGPFANLIVAKIYDLISLYASSDVTQFYHEDRWWVRNTYEEWLSRLEGPCSVRKLKRTFKFLQELKVIEIRNDFNHLSFDQTNWVTIRGRTFNHLVYFWEEHRQPAYQSEIWKECIDNWKKKINHNEVPIVTNRHHDRDNLTSSDSDKSSPSDSDKLSPTISKEIIKENKKKYSAVQNSEQQTREPYCLRCHSFSVYTDSIELPRKLGQEDSITEFGYRCRDCGEFTDEESVLQAIDHDLSGSGRNPSVTAKIVIPVEALSASTQDTNGRQFVQTVTVDMLKEPTIMELVEWAEFYDNSTGHTEYSMGMIINGRYTRDGVEYVDVYDADMKKIRTFDAGAYREVEPEDDSDLTEDEMWETIDELTKLAEEADLKHMLVHHHRHNPMPEIHLKDAPTSEPDTRPCPDCNSKNWLENIYSCNSCGVYDEGEPKNGECSNCGMDSVHGPLMKCRNCRSMFEPEDVIIGPEACSECGSTDYRDSTYYEDGGLYVGTVCNNCGKFTPESFDPNDPEPVLPDLADELIVCKNCGFHSAWSRHFWCQKCNERIIGLNQVCAECGNTDSEKVHACSKCGHFSYEPFKKVSAPTPEPDLLAQYQELRMKALREGSTGERATRDGTDRVKIDELPETHIARILAAVASRYRTVNSITEYQLTQLEEKMPSRDGTIYKSPTEYLKQYPEAYHKFITEQLPTNVVKRNNNVTMKNLIKFLRYTDTKYDWPQWANAHGLSVSGQKPEYRLPASNISWEIPEKSDEGMVPYDMSARIQEIMAENKLAEIEERAKRKAEEEAKRNASNNTEV